MDDVKAMLRSRLSKQKRLDAVKRLYIGTAQALEKSDLNLSRIVKHPERWYGI